MKNNTLKNMSFTARVEQRLARLKARPGESGSNPVLSHAIDEQAGEDDAGEESVDLFTARLEASKQDKVQKMSNAFAHLTSVISNVDSALEKSALSGKFKPDDLFEGAVMEVEKQFVLTSLSRDCIVEAIEDVQWQLQPAKRTWVLKKLMEEGRLAEALRQPLPPTDEFGTVLRKALENPAAIDPAKMDQHGLTVLLKVLESVQELRLSLPVIQDVQSLVRSNAAMCGYDLLASNFVGRKDELGHLQDFFHSENKAHWGGIVITGMGGVGKSTLLARFTASIRDQNLADIVILDFDRPGMNPADTAWMESEISVQVGELYPAAKQRLAEAREEAYRNRQHMGLEMQTQSARAYKNLILQVAQSLPADRSFLLVLDTIEEAAQRSLTKERGCSTAA
jgi:hypothetical protein